MFKMAIVGRPNVGKSALFNRICKKRIAIVDEAEGVTRDRLYAKAETFGFSFEVIDTGGIDPQTKDQFQEEIRRQAHIAIQEADTLVMVVDAEVGITQLDEMLARLLLKTEKPLTLAINKIDEVSQEERIHAFYGLGIEKMIGVSAAHGYHIAELIELAWEGFISKEEQAYTQEGTRVCIVGRPNVGKSTLVNTLLNEHRCVVSDQPGTTRDSVDIPFTFQNRHYTLIDTAGVRRKKAESDVVEKFAAIRTERAIERSDICVLMLDAQEGLTVQEKRIANQIEEAGKGCVIVLNKWDLVKGFRMEHLMRALQEDSPFLAHCPLLFISAKEARNLEKIFFQIDTVQAAMQTRITTHQLNKFVLRAMQLNHPPIIMNKRLRIYYLTQTSVQPPCFVLFVNKPQLMHDSYKKYLINSFRKAFPFTGAPLKFLLRGKQERQKQNKMSQSFVEREELDELGSGELLEDLLVVGSDDLL